MVSGVVLGSVLKHSGYLIDLFYVYLCLSTTEKDPTASSERAQQVMSSLGAKKPGGGSSGTLEFWDQTALVFHPPLPRCCPFIVLFVEAQGTKHHKIS